VLFVVSRLLLLLFLLWAQNVVSDIPDASPLALATRWDALLYNAIARDGYFHSSTVSTAVFFPVYPLLIRAAALVMPSYEWASLLVSNLCLLGAMLTIYRFVLDETGEAPLARRTLIFMLIFPASFFFSAAYTESLLVFLGALVVLCSRRRMWGWAILFCALASASRVVGIVFAGYIGLEWARSYGWRLTGIHRIAAWRGVLHGLRTDWLVPLSLPLGALGLLVFMRYLGDSYGNPKLFNDAQLLYGNTSEGPFSLLVRDIGYLLSYTQQGMYPRFQLGTNLILWLVAMAAIIPVWRRFGEELAVLTLVLLLLSASASSMSLSRYAIAGFPIFIGMALWAKNPRADRLLTIVFVALQAGLLLNWLRGPFYA
jgi:hypothetical protein